MSPFTDGCLFRGGGKTALPGATCCPMTTEIDPVTTTQWLGHFGKRFDAMLITNSGSRAEAPLGIVTIHDIPKLKKRSRDKR